MALNTDKIDDTTLALLYLTLHNGYRAWKGIDWDVLGRLHDKGMIHDPVGKVKENGGLSCANPPDGLVFGGSKTMLQLVGWVERSETHRDNCDTRWVSQELNPSYELDHSGCFRHD